MQDRPRLRPIEAFPVERDGKTLVHLKDPLNLAAPLGVSPAGYFILAHLDGQHAMIDIQEAYSKQFGDLLMSDELNDFVEMLDRNHYLASERFFTYQKSVIDEFRRLPTRAPAHMGGAYKEDPVELKAQLDGYFIAPNGPGLPSRVEKLRHRKRSSLLTSIFIAAVPLMRGPISRWWKATAPSSTLCSAPPT